MFGTKTFTSGLQKALEFLTVETKTTVAIEDSTSGVSSSKGQGFLQ